MTQTLFPEKSESQPKIYAYQELYNPHLKGLLKVGYTGTRPNFRNLGNSFFRFYH